LIAFMCQFNILGVQSNLIRPSPDRMNYVINYSIIGSGFLYVLFGICGYLVAFDKTKDNILNNFDANDCSLIIARAGLLITLMCQIPMVLVPCRDSISLLINKYINLEGDSMFTKILQSNKVISIFIASTGLFLAERVPGVSIIWSIVGSSISMILAFLFPSTAYICIWRRAKNPMSFDASMAIFICILSITMIYLCSLESIQKLYATAP
jgi:amino acid permease